MKKFFVICLLVIVGSFFAIPALSVGGDASCKQMKKNMKDLDKKLKKLEENYDKFCGGSFALPKCDKMKKAINKLKKKQKKMKKKYKENGC